MSTSRCVPFWPSGTAGGSGPKQRKGEGVHFYELVIRCLAILSGTLAEEKYMCNIYVYILWREFRDVHSQQLRGELHDLFLSPSCPMYVTRAVRHIVPKQHDDTGDYAGSWLWLSLRRRCTGAALTLCPSTEWKPSWRLCYEGRDGGSARVQ